MLFIVKAPYTIKVSVPSPLVVACSGTPVREGPIFEEDGWLSWEYKQTMPIPAYLIAIVAGGKLLQFEEFFAFESVTTCLWY